MESSLMRSRALDTLLMKPSWVWLNEMALVTLVLVAPIRLICASKRMETARPAASSSAEMIFEPEDKRASDLLSIEEDSESKRALLCAEMLVLMTIQSFRRLPSRGGLSVNDVHAARRPLE